METAPARHYRLHDVSIRTHSPHPALRQVLDDALRYKGATEASPKPADIILDFAATDAPHTAPDDAEWMGQSEHGGLEVWKASGRMYLTHEDSVVTLVPDEGTAHAALAPALHTPSDQRRDPLFYLITFSLIILLRYRGWYPLHAAALMRDGRGLLLVAESDSGKSTAALNLVREGWNYLSDDTVLLRAGAGSIRAFSFRRNFCVDPEATAHFPEMADHDWPASMSDTTKWQVDVGQLYSGQFAATCVPRVLILPHLVDAATSTLAPAEAKTALGRLINQGDLFLTPDPDVARRHLDVFRRLIDQTDIYHLAAGRDLLEKPAATSQLLTPLLGRESVS